MSVTAAQGFVAAGVAAGVKVSGDLDVALVASEGGLPVPAAGVFTSNLMTAAPVIVSRHHLSANAGHAAAVVLNAGNANAATGQRGLEHAEAMCAAVAAPLGCATDEVLVCSTGLIGIPLPVELITAAAPGLVAGLSVDGATSAAEAIRTTDTVRKEVVIAGDGFTVGGMAKGAAMLQPNMATMLAVLTTDAAATPEVLADVLANGVAGSFNRLSVDGCTSTNDTVLLLASGRAGPVDQPELALAVAEACSSLAEQMAADAEGATKVVRITVMGASSDADADVAARAVANSVLCKCSWYGNDPYWGRVASELGASGVRFEQSRLRISYGGVIVADGGVAVDHDAPTVAGHMAGNRIDLVCDLGLGPGRALVLTNDLTHAYVDENMGTS
jgi:glutamate N-acetyltransferase / amino-acid N-acetyltransferase